MQGAVENLCIHLHAAGVYHGAEQRVLLLYHLLQQHGHTHQFESGYSHQAYTTSVAHTFGHRRADAQTGIRTGAAAHSHGVEGYGVALGKGDRFIDKFTQPLVVVGAGMVFLIKDTCTVFAHRYRADIGACFNV